MRTSYILHSSNQLLLLGLCFGPSFATFYFERSYLKELFMKKLYIFKKIPLLFYSPLILAPLFVTQLSLAADSSPGLDGLSPTEINKVIQGLDISVDDRGQITFKGLVPPACNKPGIISIKAPADISKISTLPVVFFVSDPACLDAAKTTSCIFADSLNPSVKPNCEAFSNSEIHFANSGKLVCRQINETVAPNKEGRYIDKSCGQDVVYESADDKAKRLAKEQELEGNQTVVALCDRAKKGDQDALNEVKEKFADNMALTKEIGDMFLKASIKQFSSDIAKVKTAEDITTQIDAIAGWVNANPDDVKVKQNAKDLLKTLLAKAQSGIAAAGENGDDDKLKTSLASDFKEYSTAAKYAIKTMRDLDLLSRSESLDLAYRLNKERLDKATASGDVSLFQSAYNDWSKSGAALANLSPSALQGDADLNRDLQNFVQNAQLRPGPYGGYSNQAMDKFSKTQATQIQQQQQQQIQQQMLNGNLQNGLPNSGVQFNGNTNSTSGGYWINGYGQYVPLNSTNH